MGYQSGSDPRSPEATPPFAAQEDFHEILCNGHAVKPTIEANIEKGFFYSNDQCWTCYRRNYFSVQCSYTLTPHLGNQTLFLNQSGSRGQQQIQAMAMTLSAAVDGATGKTIELIQHTPKRDKGPQTAIQMTKLAPTPPGGKFAQLTDHSYSHGLASYGHSGVTGAAPPASPYLPLQNAPDEPPNRDQNGYANQERSPTSHQHTFERIQFKSATANNGKRRAQQQYYHLIVELYADVRTDSSKPANWIKVAQRASSQVVVRGRSPSHYSNEGPHSAASRGGSSGGSSMAPMGGSGMGGGGGLGSLGLSRGMGQGYGYNSVSGYRGNHYMLEPMHNGSISSSSSGSISGVVDAFPPNPRKPYILSSNDDDKHDMDSGYEYYPRALYDSILPPPVKAESQRLEMERIKDEGLFGPGSMFHQTSRGVYNADPVY
jgi:meiosis-specific transcription factor NDT80